MPRISRNLMDANFFHVMSQGINKEFIFKDEKDISTYKRLMKKYKKDLVEIIAYCVMNNHVHILVYTQDVNNLTKFMHKINTIYAIYYNQKYKRVGYVFRDRFKSEIINSDYYLKQCIDYIHLNPIKAKICKKPEMYKHSSYNEYNGKKYILTDKSIEIALKNNEYIIESVNIEFIEDENNKEKCKRLIYEFIEHRKCRKEEINKNEEILRELLVKLKIQNGISYRIIGDELEIKKDKLRRIILKDATKTPVPFVARKGKNERLY